MNTEKKKCVISGTSGFLGSRIKEYFVKNGYEIFELKHVAKNGKQDDHIIPYSLEEEINSKSLLGKDILIHCAYDFKPSKWKNIFNTNVTGSLNLLKAAKSAGIKTIVFISSIAAFDNCKSMYGKAKLEAEKEALDLGAIIIRPGLVYGQNPGGMFGALNKATSLLPIIPVIGSGNNPMYLIHIEDLCELVYKLGTGEIQSTLNPLIAAHESSKSFKDILNTMLSSKNKKALLMPIPYNLVFIMLKVVESLGMKIRFRSDNLISMMNYNPNPKFDSEILKSIPVREFNIESLRS